MPSKNVPLYLPKELSDQIDRAARLLHLPQSQCMRLSIQFGLPELLRRVAPLEESRKLPKQSKRAWNSKALAGVDLDQPAVENGDMSEDIL